MKQILQSLNQYLKGFGWTFMVGFNFVMMVCSITVVMKFEDLDRNSRFNIDGARSELMEKVRYAYMRGCDDGTNYKPDFKSGVWTDSSPGYYCDKEATGYIERNTNYLITTFANNAFCYKEEKKK